MGGVGRLVCQGFLIRETNQETHATVFWCMELDFFSLECNGVSSNEFCDVSMC